MAKATPKIEIGTMFDKNRSLHIERIQLGKKSPTYWITVKNKISRSESRLPAVTKDDIVWVLAKLPNRKAELKNKCGILWIKLN